MRKQGRLSHGGKVDIDTAIESQNRDYKAVFTHCFHRVVFPHDVQNYTVKSPLEMMAVPVPVRRAHVELNITALQLPTSGGQNGVLVIRPAGVRRHAAKDDVETQVLETGALKQPLLPYPNNDALVDWSLEDVCLLNGLNVSPDIMARWNEEGA